MAKIDLLKPKVKQLAEKLILECGAAGYRIQITQTLRTLEEQDALYAQGRTKPGKIVTNAKGGYSFHNFGVAFDICPMVNGKAVWNDTFLFNKIGKIGMKIGLEWGGTWKRFTDLPHFQYTAGYSMADIRNNRCDWKKFEVGDNVVDPSTPSASLKVIAQNGLTVRRGPGTEYEKWGALSEGESVTPLETSNGWIKIKYRDGFGWVSCQYVA